ncbi:STY4526/YPO1902 family pathogenicity island replication protein [Vibrio sp. TBV020]|uniref:STY4526/YPO1902 family pathogenicity island replication protein n=1 Tax=Vibrio sp. TBV020 TaxID=3137398 RepID=UPI0038CD1B8D
MMMQNQSSLANEICKVVVLKLADIACSDLDRHFLKAAGVSEQQIHQLKQLSYQELKQFIDQCQARVDIDEWVETLLKEEVPEPYRDYLLHGANNTMMRKWFKINANQCSEWRDVLTIDPVFRCRTVSHTQHSEVCKALNAEGDFRQIRPDTLLNIAKTHQVSLCALWNELKKWEIE